jgi:hypothetical protein
VASSQPRSGSGPRRNASAVDADVSQHSSIAGGRITGKAAGVRYTALVANDDGGGSVVLPGARGSSLQPGEWNDYEIRVLGNSYETLLNGFTTAAFDNTDPARGRSAVQDSLSGFVGLQTHTGAVSFRAVRIRPG